MLNYDIMKWVSNVYKKVYVEITNACNLSCDFCILNKRPIHYMTETEFKVILSKLKGYTNYLYFHILGEPCLHPKINEFINLASKDFKINITTNGYLIDKIQNNKNIRQLNISVHSFHARYGKSLKEYMDNILESVSILSKYTYVSFRFWQFTKDVDKIIEILEKYYNIKIDITKKGNKTLAHNVFLNISNPFDWPDLQSNYSNQEGFCYALKDHIGILSNGTIVPCCLDSNGDINLGNIFQTDLKKLQNSKKYITMASNFKNGKRNESLCKKCNFMEKRTFY